MLGIENSGKYTNIMQKYNYKLMAVPLLIKSRDICCMHPLFPSMLDFLVKYTHTHTHTHTKCFAMATSATSQEPSLCKDKGRGF